MDALHYDLLQLRGRWLKQQLLERLSELRDMSADEAHAEVKQLGREATEQGKLKLVEWALERR